MEIITSPINYLLVFLYHLTGSSLGLAIILLTILVKIALIPLSLPAMKSVQKMQALKPKLDALKNKHKDPKSLQMAQLQLYKDNGVNPASGCLPQIVQLIILIALYQVFIKFLEQGSLNGVALNLHFLWLDLGKPDPYYILPFLAGLSQLVFSLMMQSGVESHVSSPKKKDEKKKEEDSLEMAQAIQQQMIFMMPLMTVIIALKFPSGLSLYWVVSTIAQAVQQYFTSGWGGIPRYFAKIQSLLSPK